VKRFLIAILATLSVVALKAAQPLLSGNPSLKNEVKHSISRGADWLVKNQQPGGFWSAQDTPALTALALTALLSDPATSPEEKKAVDKGFAYLRSHVKEDGSIYAKKELVNYNTALSLQAFAALNDPKDKEIIKKARSYLIGTQVDMGEKGKLDNVYDGGVGYGSKYEHSDMANTLTALEALHQSRKLVSDTGAKEPELDFAAAISFLQNCQHLPSHNKQTWVSTDEANKGGFIYHPSESKAGETNTADGRVALRAYGSISYAGMLSYIYSGLSKDDARVTAVLEWLQKNYTLSENPGMGEQGLYYYYHTMAKALHVGGVDKLDIGKDKVDWRQNLALRMFDLQKQDGSWQNNNGRWFEKDPVLVTAYGVLTLSYVGAAL